MEDNSSLSRRGFISTSLTGLAAAGIAGFSPGAVFGQEQKKKTEGEIIYRTLGKTGLKMPVVSMGVMNANNPEIVLAAYEQGIRHFDTAARYQYGRNEQMVGDVTKKLGVRDKVIIGTKEMRPAQREADTPEKMIEKLKIQCEGSLKRLKTDYIDILYIHSAHSAEEASDPAIIEGMKQLKKEGKIRFSGVSTHEAMTDVINTVTENKSFDVVLTAINVSMADDVDLLAAIDNAASNGIGIIAMKTQAGGQRLPNRDSFQEFDSPTINTACLKWVMRNKSITTSIPGFTNYTHLMEDFSVAYDLEYTENERKFLTDNELQLGLGFCRQCRQCVPSCPRGVDVPNLMRVHMYAAQYGNFQHARAELDGIRKDKSISICGSCPECVASCANQVDIKNRVENLKSMYA
jgi:predicted aldo/keto reductase-like oxidoreductase